MEILNIWFEWEEVSLSKPTHMGISIAITQAYAKIRLGAYNWARLIFNTDYIPR
jgi:hypothetical protein